MAALLPRTRVSSQAGAYDFGSHNLQEKLEDPGRWYFSRREIEENSPSRQDGIDLKKETFLRKSYCTFLQDLGIKLKVPQVTIATAIVFCHRFYLRQSHAKNDRRTISTACMFLAGKVEDTPHPLKDVIIVSYEIIYKKDSSSVQRIKQKEVYEQQKELVLLAERVVLATLSFDLNVLHPYKPVVDAIKKFNVAKHALAQVAWNFVNDGLRTSLCLQFKPDYIAAGAIFLAAKFLKVKLPSDGEKVWWQEFDVTPRQLEEVSNQMLELYEQNRVPPSSQGSEVVDGGGTTTSSRVSSSKPSNEERLANASTNSTHNGGGTSKQGLLRPTLATSSHAIHDHGDNFSGDEPTRSTQCQSGDHRDKGNQSSVDVHGFEDDRERNVGGKRMRENESSVIKERHVSNGNMDQLKGTVTSQSPAQGMRKIDEDKLKELREKRKKSRGDVVAQRKDSVDEFDPIVKELEEGVELAAAQSEKKRRRAGRWEEEDAANDGNERQHQQCGSHGSKSLGLGDVENVEEGRSQVLIDRGGYTVFHSTSSSINVIDGFETSR